MAGLLVRAVADLGHADGALEATADSVVDTLGLAPRRTNTLEAVRLVASKLLRPLLHDRDGSSRHLAIVLDGYPQARRYLQFTGLGDRVVSKNWDRCFASSRQRPLLLGRGTS